MSDNLFAVEVREDRGHTIVRFKETSVRDENWLCNVWEQVEFLFHSRQLKSMSFDLQDIETLASGVFSMWVTLCNKGLEIRLLNPSALVREKLTTMRLDTVLELVDTP